MKISILKSCAGLTFSFIEGQDVDVKEDLARTSATKNTNHFDIRIYADGKSVDEIIDEFIPKLKLALANL